MLLRKIHANQAHMQLWVEGRRMRGIPSGPPWDCYWLSPPVAPLHSEWLLVEGVLLPQRVGFVHPVQQHSLVCLSHHPLSGNRAFFWQPELQLQHCCHQWNLDDHSWCNRIHSQSDSVSFGQQAHHLHECTPQLRWTRHAEGQRIVTALQTKYSDSLQCRL